MIERGEIATAEERMQKALERDRRALEVVLTRTGFGRLDPDSEAYRDVARFKELLVKSATVPSPPEILDHWAEQYCEGVALRRCSFTVLFRIKDPGVENVAARKCVLCKGSQLVTVQGPEGVVEEQCPACKGTGRQPVDTAATRAQREVYTAAIQAWKSGAQMAALALEMMGIGKVKDSAPRDVYDVFEERLLNVSRQRAALEEKPERANAIPVGPVTVSVPAREDL